MLTSPNQSRTRVMIAFPLKYWFEITQCTNDGSNVISFIKCLLSYFNITIQNDINSTKSESLIYSRPFLIVLQRRIQYYESCQAFEAIGTEIHWHEFIVFILSILQILPLRNFVRPWQTAGPRGRWHRRWRSLHVPSSLFIIINRRKNAYPLMITPQILIPMAGNYRYLNFTLASLTGVSVACKMSSKPRNQNLGRFQLLS